MWWWLLCLPLVPLVGVTLLVTIFLWWSGGYWKRRGVPALPATLFWKSFLHTIFVTKSNGNAVQAVYKKVLGMRFVGAIDMVGPNVWILDPELMKHIFVKDFEHFVDRSTFDLGDELKYMNLVLSNLTGQLWKDVRSVISPTFTSGKIKQIFPSVRQSGEQMMEYLDTFAETGEEVEVKDVYGRFTMDVIAASAFGVKCNSFIDKDAIFPKMANNMMSPPPRLFITLMMSLVFPKFLKFLRAIHFPLPNYTESMDFFADVAKETIAEREKSGVKGNDFLQLLLDARKGELKLETESDQVEEDTTNVKENQELSKSVLDESLIIAQCVIFFIAGYETTANTLGFAAYELALHPEIQEELYQEIKEVVDKHEGQVTYDGVMEMELLDKVIHETLRLHIPTFRNIRKCTKDYQIPGTDMVLQKGTLVTFPAFAIHRDERYYPNPTKFDPERFSREEKAKRNPYVFQPFGHGPRNCIGMRFALMEAKAALATTILRFRFLPSEKTQIPMKYSLTSNISRATNGVWLNVEKRSQ